jgi:hypothetical protein
VQTANFSHWSIYARCELSGFSQAANGHSAGIPETNEKFEKSSKNQTGFWTQEVTQGILRTQRFTNQEKKVTRENGHRKFKNQKDKRDSSPVESPILLMDKFVSADTDQSP